MKKELNENELVATLHRFDQKINEMFDWKQSKPIYHLMGGVL